MNDIDYKIFVPRGVNNYVRFDSEVEFEVDDISAINIYPNDDKVIYFFYVKIPFDDQHYKLLLKKNKTPKLTLLLGNNQYEIEGDSEVIDTSHHKWEEKIQISLSFTVRNASKTVNNPRETVEYKRSELLDLD